jgi:hypothetical protein
MSRSDDELDRIFGKFRSRCTYCGGELKRSGYADHPSTDASCWTVDEWRPPHLRPEDVGVAQMWAVCGPCIMRKGERGASEYLQWRYDNDELVPRRWVRELGLEDTQLVDSKNNPIEAQ